MINMVSTVAPVPVRLLEIPIGVLTLQPRSRALSLGTPHVTRNLILPEILRMVLSLLVIQVRHTLQLGQKPIIIPDLTINHVIRKFWMKFVFGRPFTSWLQIEKSPVKFPRNFQELFRLPIQNFIPLDLFCPFMVKLINYSGFACNFLSMSFSLSFDFVELSWLLKHSEMSQNSFSEWKIRINHEPLTSIREGWYFFI